MKKYYYFLILLLIVSSLKISSDPVVCFFFKPQQDTNKITNKLKKPGKLAKHTIHSIVEHIPVAGIYTTYSGYITISDEMGEVRFPRKHRENTATIIVTQNIEPIALFDNTILHWKLIPNVPADMYELEEIYDPATRHYSWKSHQVNLPADHTIPIPAIVILAKPKNIFISSEAVKTLQTANLMLPPVYVKKGINIMSSGINTLIFRHLFRPVENKTQQTATRISTHLIN